MLTEPLTCYSGTRKPQGPACMARSLSATDRRSPLSASLSSSEKKARRATLSPHSKSSGLVNTAGRSNLNKMGRCPGDLTLLTHNLPVGNSEMPVPEADDAATRDTQMGSPVGVLSRSDVLTQDKLKRMDGRMGEWLYVCGRAPAFQPANDRSKTINCWPSD